MKKTLFDTHAHLISEDWSAYPPKALRSDLPVPERTDYTVSAESLIAMMDEHDVAKACVVQRGHIYGYDNSYILDSAKRYPGRLLPIVILDAQDPQTPAVFTDLVRTAGVRGFRLASARPWLWDTAWMNSPAAMEIWKTCADLHVPMTLIFFQDHLSYALPALKIIAKMYPNLPIVIDHVGTAYALTNVEIGIAREEGRSFVMPGPPDFGINDTVRIFEDCPNIYFKVTEINFERLEEVGIKPARMVRRLADSFGAGRLVWGSDIGQSVRWPYPVKTAMARASAEYLDKDEAVSFLHDNAARIYGDAPR